MGHGGRAGAAASTEHPLVGNGGQDVSLAGWERGACLRPICNFVMRTSPHRICRMRVGLAVAWAPHGMVDEWKHAEESHVVSETVQIRRAQRDQDR